MQWCRYNHCDLVSPDESSRYMQEYVQWSWLSFSSRHRVSLNTLCTWHRFSFESSSHEHTTSEVNLPPRRKWHMSVPMSSGSTDVGVKRDMAPLTLASSCVATKTLDCVQTMCPVRRSSLEEWLTSDSLCGRHMCPKTAYLPKINQKRVRMV